jgi:outer membrane protein OmpA-like peptidoglycan-associated protein/Tol biopolymer transport system component
MYTSATNGNYVYMGMVNMTQSFKVSTPAGAAVTTTLTVDTLPQFSADGTKVVWSTYVNFSRAWTIKMANSNGTNPVTVASGTSANGFGDIATKPSFSPDGSKIVLAYDNDIHIIDAAASQTIGASNRIIDSSGMGISAGSPQYVSATKIAYVGEQSGHSCGSGYYGIYVKDLTVSGVGTLLTNTCRNSPRIYTSAYDVSPDGNWVVFRATDAYGIIGVAKTDNTGSRIAAYTSTGYCCDPGDPVWSPDGTKIAFSSSNAMKVYPFDGTTVGTGVNATFPSGVTGISEMRWVPSSVNFGAATTTTAAPAATTTVPKTSTGLSTGAGITVTDTKVYTATTPAKVSAESAITVMTAAQAKVQEIVSLTPSVCVPNDDDIVFIDTGKCRAQILNEKTGKVLRTLKTTVVADEVSSLKVGNEIAILAPIYFESGSSDVNAKALARLKSIKAQVSAAGSVLLVGHSGALMGDTAENRALAKARATNTAKALKNVGATGPFYATSAGALDPVTRVQTQSAQDKNRRVVVILVP